MCVCVCVCVVREQSTSERERERETEIESVCLDQLHSKSVYSAQFGIKHNRLLSACYRLWLPIKMEFIAALRASPNYTFFPLSSVLFPLSHLHFFLFHGCSNSGGVGCFFFPPFLAAAVRQVVITAHYRPERAGAVGRPTYPSAHHCHLHLNPSEWRSDIVSWKVCTVHECGGITCS